MNAILQSQLDRVEAALTTLIDSIAAYSPSTSTANTLLAADDALQAGLQQLAQHQKNHNRILRLQGKISQQNAQITSTLTALADTRTDLLSTPTSLPQKDTRNVPYAELLDYAKRISRYTLLPNSRPPLALPKLRSDPAQALAINGDAESEKEGDPERKGKGTDELPDEEKAWLEALRQMPSTPWISEDTMKRGALAQIQAMVERGEDPANQQLGEIGGEHGEMKENGEDFERGQKEGVIGGDNAGIRQNDKRQERKVENPEVFGGLDLYDPSNPEGDG